MEWLQHLSPDAALSIMPKKTFFILSSIGTACCNRYILEYTDTVKLQCQSTAAVMIIPTYYLKILGYTDAVQLQRQLCNQINPPL
jgi:hypothetical protein